MREAGGANGARFREDLPSPAAALVAVVLIYARCALDSLTFFASLFAWLTCAAVALFAVQPGPILSRTRKAVHARL